MKNILDGTLVRLSAVDPEELGKTFSNWNRDSEFYRLLDSGAASVKSIKATKDSLEKELPKKDESVHWFTIRERASDRLLGDIVLNIVRWNDRDAFVGLGIGERDFWGRGYGTQAMNLILEFAFIEINLRRVTLTVFEYNPRAIRSYEKAGFRHEGRLRQTLSREGRRWDILYMGILREEWLEHNKSQA